MVKQDSYPLDFHCRRVAHKSDIALLEHILHVLRKGRLRLSLPHRVVVARRYDDLDVLWDQGKVLGGFTVLVIHVEDMQLLFLPWIYADTVYQIASNKNIAQP